MAGVVTELAGRIAIEAYRLVLRPPSGSMGSISTRSRKPATPTASDARPGATAAGSQRSDDGGVCEIPPLGFILWHLDGEAAFARSPRLGVSPTDRTDRVYPANLRHGGRRPGQRLGRTGSPCLRRNQGRWSEKFGGPVSHPGRGICGCAIDAGLEALASIWILALDSKTSLSLWRRFFF